MCKETSKTELQEQMLKDAYVSIKREPFKIPVDDGNDFMLTFVNPIREGWLWKKGGRYKNWKRRWFILNDGCLYYFEFTANKEPRGIIPLENVNVREVEDKTKQFCFEIYSTTNDKNKACKHDSEGKVIEGILFHFFFFRSFLCLRKFNECFFSFMLYFECIFNIFI